MLDLGNLIHQQTFDYTAFLNTDLPWKMILCRVLVAVPISGFCSFRLSVKSNFF